MKFELRDPDFERRVRATFARQAAMQLLGVTVERVAPGAVGRTLSVVTGELRAFTRALDDPDAGDGELVALLTGTMMTVRGRPDLAD